MNECTRMSQNREEESKIIIRVQYVQLKRLVYSSVLNKRHIVWAEYYFLVKILGLII